MRQISFLGTVFATLALWGFLTGSLAAYPTLDAPGKPSGATAVSDWERVAEAKPAKPADPKPEKEEPGLLIKTLNKLIGNDKDQPAEKDSKNKSAKTSKAKTAKAADPKPEKEEPGLLTKALKKLVGSDDDKKKDAKRNPLNPINIAPTASATQKPKEDKPQAKTVMTETKAALKDSFKKLIGVDAARDKAKASGTVVKSAKQEESGVTSTLKKILGVGDNKDQPAGKAPPAKTRQAKKEESGGLFKGILDGDGKKKKSTTAQQAQAETSEEPAVKRTSGQTRKYLGKISEEDQLDEDRGGVKKGKNILKESFKALVADEKKEEAVEE